MARSVVVSNIAPSAEDEDIPIYFQRLKHGGGQISHLHIPDKGTAVVTFDENEGLYWAQLQKIFLLALVHFVVQDSMCTSTPRLKRKKNR